MTGNSLEGLVHWPVPAEEGAGCKEDQPEDGEAKVNATGHIRGEESQAGEKVEEQGYTVDCGRRRGGVVDGKTKELLTSVIMMME